MEAEQEYRELVDGILRVLPGNVLRIVLYGSVARGTADRDSDVDVAVFIKSALDAVAQDRLSDVVVEMDLKYDRVFSVIDIEEAVYAAWKSITPFYRNIDRDGIVLWTAA